MSDSADPRVASTKLLTAYGEFDFHCFAWGSHEEQNVLVLSNLPASLDSPLCRIQSACYTGEIFGSLDCDCHEQLTLSLQRIQREGGLFIYYLCDGRGAGIFTKTLGLELGRTQGLDTSDAYLRLGVSQDPRQYSRAAFVLRYMNINRVRLLTNNPRKIDGLAQFGFTVQRESLEVEATPESVHYLETKSRKMGHLLSQFNQRKGA